MILKIKDGRDSLWQWDTGRKVVVEEPCDIVHFSNLKYGKAVPVAVEDGEAFIPDELLQIGGILFCYAFVGEVENGYTMHEEQFEIERKPKPNDYFFTPTEYVSLLDLDKRVTILEEREETSNFSPIVEVFPLENGHRVQITDVNGVQFFDVLNGTNGKDGYTPVKGVDYFDGKDGYTPVKGKDYFTEEDKEEIVNELAEQAPVQSVNGKGGAVVLSAEDVGALPDDTEIPEIPENVSAFNNDAGYLTEHQSLENYPTKSEVETDFIVAKAEFVEALGKKQDALEKYVESVNGYSGKVVLSASDVKALPDTTAIPTVPNNVSEFVNDAGYLTEHQSLEEYAKKTETDEKIATHNVSDSSHQDIRLLITNLVNRLNAIADSDDTTLDQLSEIVAYIKSNKNLIDAITTEKISYADIVNNLTTNVTNKPLSASMGVALKAAIDAIIIPTKVSQLENDSGFAKASDVDVKLGNKQDKLSEYVSTVNSKSGAVVLTYADVGALPSDTVIPTIPKNVSAFENDKSYVTSTELTTKLSGKQDKLTSYVGSVNGKTGNVTLNAADVGALPSTTVIPPSYEPFYIDCTINQEGGVFSAVATSDTPKQEEVDTAFASGRPVWLRWEAAGIYIQCLARVYVEGIGSIYNFVTIVNEVSSMMQFMNGGFYNTYFVAQEKIAVVSDESAVEEGKITIVV